MTQILQPLLSERTLRLLEIEVVLCQAVKDFFEMVKVVCEAWAINQDIIEEYYDKTMEEWFQEFFHG